MMQAGKTQLHTLALWLWKRIPLPRSLRWIALWLFNTKFLVGVVGVVFDDQERILLAHHTYRNRYPWGLPGGWVGAHETLEAGLVRELSEETGFVVTVDELYAVRSDYPHPQTDLYFLCTYQGGTFQPNTEIDAVEYFPVSALPTRILPSQRPMIERGLQRHRERQTLHQQHEES